MDICLLEVLEMQGILQGQRNPEAKFQGGPVHAQSCQATCLWRTATFTAFFCLAASRATGGNRRWPPVGNAKRAGIPTGQICRNKKRWKDRLRRVGLLDRGCGSGGGADCISRSEQD